MEHRLVQHQTQKMLLSPQVRLYLKLLQLPLANLEQAVETELEENPLLEEKLVPSDEAAPVDGTNAGESAPDSPQKDNGELQVGETFDHFELLDENFQESYRGDDLSQKDPKDLQKIKNFQENLITKPEALTDFLLWQAGFLDLTEAEKATAQEIIGNIDEDGYLRTSLDEIAAARQVPVSEVEMVLSQIHELDPPGIGARDLQEALRLQLERKGPDAQLSLEILSKHFTLLQKRDIEQLAKIYAVDPGTIKKAVEMISNLEPRPGRTFYSNEPTAVTPDATVSLPDEEDGKLKIEIHDEVTPHLRINPYYRRLLRKRDLDTKTKVFIREKMQNAINFMKALILRKSTLGDITAEIVKSQPEFFEKGFSHLRPLRLKDIAQGLGIHESTVSRALAGKYICTPQGTIPYKSFFSTRMDTTTGPPESQKSLMAKIRTMIEQEDPRTPLTDHEIRRRLQEEGVIIARRTVAKYRDLLKILPSHLRRK